MAGVDQYIDLSFPEEAASVFEPGMILGCTQVKSGFGDGRQIFTSMIPIDDLNCVREMPFDQFPNPSRAITDKDEFFIEISLALTRTRPKQIAELFPGLEVTGIADILCLQVILFSDTLGMAAAFLI